MSVNFINQVAYIRTSREFPEDAQPLSIEVSRMYIDIANAINVRSIGIFPINRPAQTGNEFFISRNKNQKTFRQVYLVTPADITAGFITHNIKNVFPGQFIMCEGSYTDGTNTYGLFFASSVAIAGQITFYVTATQIVFSLGGGAPVLTEGLIILEWLSQAAQP